jgi:hypothetical protein
VTVGGKRLAALVLIATLALAALTAVACAPSKAAIAAAHKDECFANEAKIKTAMNLVNADTGFYPKISDAVRELHVSCPDGGTYSFDEKTDTVSCSVHGHP